MNNGLALLASSPVVVAGMGSLAVAVAAVVVVLAIVAVVVMVLRNNGAGRQAAGGLGYDARSGTHDEYGDYNAPPPPWGRQPGGAQPPGAWQNGGNGYGGAGGPGGPNGQPAMGGRNSGANWGQPAMGEAQVAPAWGGAASNDPARAWANQAQAVNSMPHGQGQQPWEAPAPDAGPPAWGGDQQGWANAPAQQSAAPSGPGAWGQPGMGDAQVTPAWSGQPQAAPQSTPPWGGPPAAPEQNAWGVPAATSLPQANAWGVPAAAPQPAAPQQNTWGANGSPSGANWGNPPPMPTTPSTQPWGGPGAQNGYDAAPPPAPYGMNGVDRGRVGGNMRPGAIMVKEGKEPGRVFEVRGNRLTIGRSRDSDIFLEDLAVSRLHATVNRDPSGQYFVRDEGSANGTTVNGQRISEQVLEEGDEIGLGQTVLTFVRH